MAQYIETTIRYEKETADGSVKKSSERYLVNAETFTEAEAKIVEERKAFISGEFEVSAVKKSSYVEIIRDINADEWIAIKAAFAVIDERTGAEKTKSNAFLVQAKDLEDAIDKLHKALYGSVSDYKITSASATDILEVYDANYSDK